MYQGDEPLVNPLYLKKMQNYLIIIHKNSKFNLQNKF